MGDYSVEKIIANDVASQLPAIPEGLKKAVAEIKSPHSLNYSESLLGTASAFLKVYFQSKLISPNDKRLTNMVQLLRGQFDREATVFIRGLSDSELARAVELSPPHAECCIFPSVLKTDSRGEEHIRVYTLANSELIIKPMHLVLSNVADILNNMGNEPVINPPRAITAPALDVEFKA